MIVANKFDRKYNYRGWTLVNVGDNYYSACKGTVRAAVGAEHHGDVADLIRRFRKKVDQIEARDESTDD